MNDVEIYIQASKNVLDIFKTMIGMFPQGKHQADAQSRLIEAEQALRTAEVQLAKSLGYHLCQCTFPPQIMLSQGRHRTQDQEFFKCEKCNKQYPSERHFQNLDAADEQMRDQRNRGGWM